MQIHFPHRLTLCAAAMLAALVAAPPAVAQTASTTTVTTTAAAAHELEPLVARIALYPDDLVAIILPASTNPIQLVQAERFLQQRKKDPKAPVNESWDDPVKALVNYPEVVTMMSQDLDWTTALGEAVAADAGEVMEAVQAFRRKTQSAGNLKSDDKQTVVVEKEVVKIVPANPEVIYVPQYDPATVVVAGSYYSSWGYWPAPYPVYYYPYAPGAAFAAGVIWGAALGAIWNGGHYGCSWGGGGNNNININTDRSRNNISAGSGNSTWKSSKKPGEVGGRAGASTSNRVGDARGGAGAGGARSPSAQPANRGGGAGVSDRAGGGQAGGGNLGGASASTRDASRGSSAGSSAFDGANRSGRQTQMDSSRGASSRQSMSSGASRGGGGARAGGGGGGGGRRR